MDRWRRLGHSAAIAISVLMLTDCASMRVNSYLERGTDLTRYHSYNWAADDRLSTGDPRLDNNSFFLERLQADVEKQLTSRGFEKVTAGTPDLWLHYHVNIDQRIDVNSADRQYGDCGACSPSVYDAGTLMLDFVDARSNRLFWRGWAEGSLDGAIDNQDWMEQRIDEAVTRILARFPRRL
jgi:Domain of unknown function (DUF4136)